MTSGDIVRQVAGNMALSGLELTEWEKARLLYFVEHPEEQEAMMEAAIKFHT